MARDPADSGASPFDTMADADLGTPAELKHSHSHSLPNGTADLKETSSLPSDLKASNSLPTDLNAAAGEEELDMGAAAEQPAAGRRRNDNPLSVCSAPAHVLEGLRLRSSSAAASGSPLRTVSESPRTMRSKIMRHSCAFY